MTKDALDRDVFPGDIVMYSPSGRGVQYLKQGVVMYEQSRKDGPRVYLAVPAWNGEERKVGVNWFSKRAIKIDFKDASEANQKLSLKYRE